jgi:cysteine desulfurase family protein (TIGR01976 family)
MFDVHQLRQQFPSLQKARDGRLPIFLDGPGGTQVPQRVVDAMVHYLTTCNSNHGGVFATSRESDAIVRRAHEAVADFLNAPSPDEVVFGANMTTLTFHLSRAIAKTLNAGDEIMVTRLDHDANIRPWVLAARDAGATIRWIDIHPEDCTLDLKGARKQLSSRTRLVAVGAASNATGTINDVAKLTGWAHEAGALVFVDAVHYAPHGPIDVQKWDCDFLAFSAYKVFGPHVGVLWTRRQLLETLPVYKLKPSSDALPDRWMTGTQNHEGLAGVAAAMEYLAEIGVSVGSLDPPRVRAPTPRREMVPGRRGQIRRALRAIQAYEGALAGQLLAGLAVRPHFKVWGITRQIKQPPDPGRLVARVPTISITHPRHDALAIAEHLAARHIYAWNGNMYALELSEHLGLEARGGFLRLGLVHYNTADEIKRLLRALDEFD